MLAIGWSTLLFVAWHPLNALTINPSAPALFLDPAFLLISAALGITCGYSYVVSKSLWVPVLIHWATVVVWVFFLGGRNLVLEL
jgi:predicted Abi (CAAX) family protease